MRTAQEDHIRSMLKKIDPDAKILQYIPKARFYVGERCPKIDRKQFKYVSTWIVRVFGYTTSIKYLPWTHYYLIRTSNKHICWYESLERIYNKQQLVNLEFTKKNPKIPIRSVK